MARDKNGTEVQLSRDQVLAKYFREFSSWKFRSQLHGRENVSSSILRPLNDMVTHLVRGYLEHGDVQTALELLQSAQYGDSMPGGDLVRRLISLCFGSSERRGKSVDAVMAMECTSYLRRVISSPHANALLMDLTRSNFLSQDGSAASISFWDILHSVLDLSEPALFMPLLYTIIEQSFLGGHLRTLLIAGLDDRRLRRRFISTHLFAIFRILSLPDAVALAVKIISLLLDCLVSDRERCDSFLDHIYEQAGNLETNALLLFLSQLSGSFALELTILILERRFRLGDSSVRRPCSVLSRIRAVITNLEHFRVEDRSGVTRNFDRCVFYLLRRLIVTFPLCCRFPALLSRKSERDVERTSIVSLLSEDETQALLDACRRLTFSVDWPGDIKAILAITVDCMERHCPDRVIIL